MGVETNGHAVQPKKTKANGNANGHLVPRKAVAPKIRKQSGLTARIASLAIRLLVWYALVIAAFQCPSSPNQLTDESNSICKPYLAARSHVAPYVQPYYDRYGSPYVAKARPYLERVDQRIYQPTIQLGKESYQNYGAPRVDAAREYGLTQWRRTLKPQFDTAGDRARSIYDSSIGPHFQEALSVVRPYYDAGTKGANDMYNKQLFPAYIVVRPYADKAYSIIHKAVVETGLPYAQWIANSVMAFTDRTIWPQLRILYGENVEPQLMRIGERLGRYRDGQKLKQAMEEINSSIASAPTTSPIKSLEIESTPDPSISEQEEMPTSVADSTAASSPLTTEEEAQQLKETLESDLATWQEKFASAAGKGTEDLHERVKEITNRQIDSQVNGVGQALVVQLEESASSELSNLKKSIVKIVSSLSDEPQDDELGKAEQRLSQVVRDAGGVVRAKGQALRTWKQNCYDETRRLVTAATDSTLEVIDNIRDLGLQEIGMRWAWMEGVTYKDWSKYHALKKTFADWRVEVEAMSREHEGLTKLIVAAEEVESNGMAVAETTAKELMRLKEVGIWKIQTKDASDDFATRIVPVGAAKAGQAMKDGINSLSENIVGTATGTLESLASSASQQVSSIHDGVSSKVIGSSTPLMKSAASAASQKASRALSDASESIVGTPVPTHESVASQASSSIASAASAASDGITKGSSKANQVTSKVFAGAMAQEVPVRVPIFDDYVEDEDESTYSEKLQILMSQAGDKFADITKAVGEAMLAPTSTQDSFESATSIASAKYLSALAAASSALYGTQTGAMESATNAVVGGYANAVNAASSIIYGTPTPAIQSLKNEASSRYSKAISDIEEQRVRAISIASAQISGTPAPVHEQIFASIESGYSAALGGASSRFSAALNVGSTAVQGTTASPQDRLVSSAKAQYSAAVAAASSNLEAAKSAVGNTQTPRHEAALSAASLKYSEFVSNANAQYASATAAASSAVNSAAYGPPQGVFESISFAAASRLANSLSAASAQYSSVKSAVGATPTPAYQGYTAEAQRRYYEGVGLAHEQYSEFLAAASTALYGAPTPTHRSLFNAASSAVIGTSTPAYESLLVAAQSQFAQATALASENLKVILGSASSAVGATSKSPAQSVLDSASEQYSAAVLAASASLSSASSAASVAIYGTPVGAVASISSALSDQAASAASAVSSGVYGTEAPWTESIASQASENWEALVSKASAQVYGSATPVYEAYTAHITEATNQASGYAAAQFAAVQAVLSEAFVGKEPDFTESIMSRINSVYATGYHVSMASSASSYASEAYASASSVVSTIYTPPPALESILDSASEQVNAAVEAASIQFYGTSKGAFEKATSAAAESYSAAQSKASEAVYGSQTGYAVAAQSSILDAASSAQDAISAAIWGTSTAQVESATSAAENAYASITSVAKENLSAASSAISENVSNGQAKASSAIYGPEQGAVESAQSRLGAAVESAKARLAQMVAGAGEEASDTLKSAQSGVENMASSVSEAIGAATDRVKDEL